MPPALHLHDGGDNIQTVDWDREYLTLLDKIEAELVEELCGSRYERKEDKNFSRYKTRERTIYSKFGKITKKVVIVYNKETGESFSPLLLALGIEKHQHSSLEFKMILGRKSTRSTYQLAQEDTLDSFVLKLSRQTIYNYAKEVLEYVNVESKNKDGHKILLADGTKIPSGDRKHHEARCIVSLNKKGFDKNLLKKDINQPWKEMTQMMNLKQYRAIVADGEKGLACTFTEKGLEFHYCHKHAERDLGYYLWQDGVKNSRYNPYLYRLKQILYTLQNSTEKHKKDKNWKRLKWRITRTINQIADLANELLNNGLEKSASFLKRNGIFFVTAAKLAIEGINVPWTTNIMERIMQEVGKRTKKKGMYWSEKGLETIITPVLKRYFNPKDKRTVRDIYSA